MPVGGGSLDGNSGGSVMMRGERLIVVRELKKMIPLTDC